jgi:hypothetical protein
LDQRIPDEYESATDTGTDKIGAVARRIQNNKVGRVGQWQPGEFMYYRFVEVVASTTSTIICTKVLTLDCIDRTSGSTSKEEVAEEEEEEEEEEQEQQEQDIINGQVNQTTQRISNPSKALSISLLFFSLGFGKRGFSKRSV